MIPCQAAGTVQVTPLAAAASAVPTPGSNSPSRPPQSPGTATAQPKPPQVQKAEPSLIAPTPPNTNASAALPRVDFSAVTSRLTALPNAPREPTLGSLRPSIFQFIPTLSISQAVTDNVDQTATGKNFDAFTTLEAATITAIQTDRLIFTEAGTFDYTKYVETPANDGYLVNASATGQAELIKQLLFVQSNISIANLNSSANNISAIDRPTGSNLSVLTTYDVSPYLTETFANLIDVLLRGRYAELKFQDNGAAAAPNIVGSRFNQAGAQLSTGSHIRMYEMSLSGQYLKDNHGFVSQNTLYSIMLGDSTGIRLVGRGGYESIKDPGITRIDGPIWLAGIQTNGKWQVDVEYGNRFGGPVWYGNVSVPVTSVLAVEGSYTKSLRTAQSRLQRSLDDVLNTAGDFDINIEPLSIVANLALVSGTFVDEEAVAGLVWSRTPVSAVEGEGRIPRTNIGEARTYISLTGGLSHRKFLNPVGEDRSGTLDLTINHTINHRLVAKVNTGISKDLDALGGGPKNTTYYVRANLTYQLTPQAEATFTYGWVDNLAGDNTSVAENVVQFTLSKTF
ncbi:MAG: hypothetical protein WAW96_10180 [Alphaproteobacteria bacterium]